MTDLRLDPAFHGFLPETLASVHQTAEDDLSHFPQTCTGWTGSSHFVEGKVRHVHFQERRAALRAGEFPLGAFIRFIPPLDGRRIKGAGRDILPALGTGAAPEPGK